MGNHFALEDKFVSCGIKYEDNMPKALNNLACALDALSYAMPVFYDVEQSTVKKDIKFFTEYFGHEHEGLYIPLLEDERNIYNVDWLYKLFGMSDDKANKAEIFDYIFNMANEYLAKASNNTYCVQNWEQLKGFLIDSFDCWKKDQYYRAAGNDKSLFQEPSRIIAQLRAENDKLKEQIAAMQNQQQSNGAPSV